MSLISIIICTRNRAQDLRATLRSLAGVEAPENMEVEVLVVDNASTDDTRAVVDTVGNQIKGLHYIYEGAHGKLHGLNRGLDEAIGQYIIFTDDDLRFPPNWLTDTYAPLWQGTTDAIVGGIEIASHLKKPWVTKKMEQLMASTEFYEKQEMVELIGANMGFNRYVLEKVPRFDTELGPGALGQCDDSLFSRQLQEAGFRIQGAFDTKIQHHFDPNRLYRKNVIRRFVNQGRSLAYCSYHWEHESISLAHYRHLLSSIYHLVRWRLLNWNEWHKSEGIDMREMVLIEQYAFFKQFIWESRRSRNYERRGLVKKLA